MTYVIGLPCVDVKDRACVEECPVDCIYEGERSLYIHPEECVDCGACEPVCPVEAIYYEDDLPGDQEKFLDINAEFFNELGSPGGAARLGPTHKDPPAVAARPPQGERLAGTARTACLASLGRPSPRPGVRLSPIPTASSMCRWAPRSIPPRALPSLRSRRLVTPTVTRRCGGLLPCEPESWII